MSPAQGAHEAAVSWGPEKPEWLCPSAWCPGGVSWGLASLSLPPPDGLSLWLAWTSFVMAGSQEKTFSRKEVRSYRSS